MREDFNKIWILLGVSLRSVNVPYLLHGVLVKGHRLVENDRLYKIVELPRVDGRRLVASLHVFDTESDKGTRWIDARFDDLRMAKHAVHCLAMYGSDRLHRLS